MIVSWPESQPGDRAKFERFRSAIQSRCPDVRFAWIGGNLLVVGTVAAYALKAGIEVEAKDLGLVIQNCVRVVPGRDYFATQHYPLAG